MSETKKCIFLGFISILCHVVADDRSNITIGIIATGTNTVETEILSRNGQQFVIVKHLVDTREMFYILRSVKLLDADPNVDIILVMHYDVNLLKAPQILQTSHKKLVKLGVMTPRDNKISRLPSERMGSFTCSSNSEFINNLIGTAHCLKSTNSTLQNGDDVLISMPELPVVRSMIKALKWRSIAIFYETSTEWQMSKLVDGLSKDGVLIALYNIDHVSNMQKVLQELYQTHVENNKDIEIVIVCRLSNTKHILKAAYNFDPFNNQKTLLKMFSRWLVVLYGYDKDALKIFQQNAFDIDNIAVVAVPRPHTIDMQALSKGIDCTSLEVFKETIGSDPVNFKTVFVKRLEENAKSWNPTNYCKGYYIETLLWRAKSRELSPVGHADFNGNVVLNSEIFPNIKYGYNKRWFLISTLEYSPFVIKRKENNTYIYEGFCLDLIQELANKLNFTYNLTEPADGKWGGITNRVNLTFNGLVGQLQREEVDIVAAPISIQAERDPAMDFSYPYYYEYTTVLVKKPDVNSIKWRTLIDPFKFEVLLTIGASLLVVTVLVFLLERYNPFYTIPEYAEERVKNGGLHTWHSSFWYVFGALLCQGGVHLPESTAGRTLISCWWLTCIIIVGTYCGNLIAFLTVTKEKPPFNSLQEMNDLKDTYKWGTLGGTAWETTFPNSSNKAFRAMGEAFIKFNKTDPTILHTSPSFHVERVKKGKYAWIGDKTTMEIAMATECSLVAIKEEFMPLIYVFGFKNKSPHAAIFSEQMIKIHESGLLEIWKRKWWPKSSFCAGNSLPEAKPISLMDVQSAFYVCVIGIFVGLLTFIIEIIVHRCKSCSKKTGVQEPPQAYDSNRNKNIVPFHRMNFDMLNTKQTRL
ncbi:glutamate receptor ionotropic, kainate glr-3-like isoform X1 [Ruditapes philippinarum]|uniref:glutamate receptor ionotropic, kainate glr-3-like isoform X1 n=1 Tax=Ruditapes philippinarum TaxID=129788 RepID=UPI00295B9ADB|nr:glutamate receptor ionotropic, kainate glr-3-like isoform X1 [Ruditapes philippinarum]